MTTYYIYEVTGHKNGATKEWDKRSQYNFETYGVHPILIETMEGPNTPEFWQIVGDREWELADLNGYPRGTHYLEVHLKGSIGGVKNKNPNSRNWANRASEVAYIGINSRKLNGQYKSDEWKEFCREKNNKTKTCPHCGVTQKVMSYGRYHGDRCKHKA